MNQEEKQKYMEEYHVEKEKGVPFFPDIVFKDAVISLVIFIVLVALAYFVGAPLEARANPADTTYTPRPEWYFLFLYQLLKYFPGNLEVIGAVVVPTIVILTLFALPFIDRSAKRHPFSRPFVVSGTLIIVAGIGLLTFLSAQGTPPPTEVATGDQTAALYIQNCAPCHGASINVPTGTNLHEVIAQGKHEGMPAWSADLTSNEIDALAGFILSPTGSNVFDQFCSSCHKATDLVSYQPLDLEQSIDQGLAFPAHQNQNVPDFSKVLSSQQRSLLLNFLAAPDGRRLFVTNCEICHGNTINFTGTEAQLLAVITKGGQHLEMPAWRQRLSDSDLETLAQYVTNPSSSGTGAELFAKDCASCHGDRVPSVSSIDEARNAIQNGGAHITMPVWGNVLTTEQLDALATYAYSLAQGSPVETGSTLFATNCAPCHGTFGEGGPNPTNPSVLIPPISTGEFLKTRDDATLRAIISQGQPDAGMSPFGSANGGPLSDDQIDAIVAFMRSWEANPPVQQAPTPAPRELLDLSGTDIYKQLCSQCHGLKGEGGVSSSLTVTTYQNSASDEDIYNTISQGVAGTTMIGWRAILSEAQIQALVQYIRQLGKEAPIEPTPTPTPTQSTENQPTATPGEAATATKAAPTPTATATPTAAANAGPTYEKDILPIFSAKCAACHGNMGGWNGNTYQDAINSGDNGPVVVPGDAQNSLLAQKIQGTQKEGMSMPPGSKLTDDEIQLILDWINQGAKEK